LWRIFLFTFQLKKPAIYLYPEIDSQINVSLDLNGKLTKTEPEYRNGWQIFATKDGIIDNRYDYLFWEADLNELEPPAEGWVVGYADLENWFDLNLPILGHHSIDMTMRYLETAGIDSKNITIKYKDILLLGKQK